MQRGCDITEYICCQAASPSERVGLVREAAPCWPGVDEDDWHRTERTGIKRRAALPDHMALTFLRPLTPGRRGGCYHVLARRIPASESKASSYIFLPVQRGWTFQFSGVGNVEGCLRRSRARVLNRIEPSASLIHVTWSLLGYSPAYSNCQPCSLPAFYVTPHCCFSEGTCLYSSLFTLQGYS